MAVLLNGDGYQGITAQQDADLYAGLAGSGRLVLNIGKKMAAEIVDNNTVRIYDGEMITNGRRIHIDAGTYDDFIIETGTQGTVKYYTIGYRLYSDDGKQLCEQQIKSDSSQITTFDEGDFRDGATDIFVSVYRIKQDGISLVSATQLFDQIYSASEVKELLADTGWLTPDYESWTKDPVAGTKVRYRKKNGVVYVQGTLGLTGFDGENGSKKKLFTLPEGFRPANYFYTTNTATGSKISRVFVTKTGGLSIEWIRNISDGSEAIGDIPWIGIDFCFPV